MPDIATNEAEAPLSARLREVDRQENAGEPIIAFREERNAEEEAAQQAAHRAAAQQDYARQQREASASNAQLQIMKASTNGARNELELVRAGLMAKFELITSIINLKTDELDDTRKAILSVDAALQALA